MSLRVFGLRVLVGLGLAAGACAGDDDGGRPGPTCGPGTVLENEQCVAKGGNDGGGTSASMAGGPSDSQDAGAPSAGAGASSTGGSAGAGAPPGDGGVDGVAGGGSSEAGSGGAFADPDPPVATRWFAFEHEDGAFVYDVSKFPAADASVQLGDGRLGAWAPNGSKLLYSDAGNWYVREMSGTDPGVAVLLIDPPSTTLPVLTWSADSQSISTRLGTTLAVFQPNQAGPAMHTLTTTLVSASWAPVGNKLLYLDALGVHVVEVIAGTPGQPLDVDSSLSSWAPTGQALAGATASGDLTYAHLSGNGSTFTTLFDVTTPEMATEGFDFSPDGARLATTAWKERAYSDVYYVDLLPTPGELTLPYSPLTSDLNVASAGFSPDSNWLIYQRSDDSHYAVDVSGASPGEPISLPAFPNEPLWLSGEPRFFYQQPSSSLWIFDLLDPQNPQGILSDVDFGALALGPSGQRLAYDTEQTLHVLDLEQVSAATIDITLAPLNAAIWRFAWAPSGGFIAAITRTSGGQYQQRLVRIDGDSASSPIDLGSDTFDTIAFRWQP